MKTKLKIIFLIPIILMITILTSFCYAQTDDIEYKNIDSYIEENDGNVQFNSLAFVKDYGAKNQFGVIGGVKNLTSTQMYCVSIITFYDKDYNEISSLQLEQKILANKEVYYKNLADESQIKAGYTVDDICYYALEFVAQEIVATNTNSTVVNYNSYDYVIENYDIDMIVNKDNTYDITETLDVNFNVPKHGIFRKIPLKNTVKRVDGSSSENSAQITNIEVSEKNTISTQDGYRVIKIGDANRTVTGKKTYIIQYTYNIGKDPLPNADEFYFNLIGSEWDAPIKKASFNITMPEEFDKKLLGFSSGKVGSTNSSNVEYTVNGNVITGNLKSPLSTYQALTIRLSLPDGYFVGAGHKMDIFSIFVIILSIAFVFIAFKLWEKYGRDDQVVETVEFYPPENYNSAEVGFLYNGAATDEAVISLLIYLANKGYLKIEETETKVFLLNKKGFKITKLKEYDGTNETERIFFDGLFKGNTYRSLNMNKAREIMQEAKLHGEKISFQDALELSIETKGDDNPVAVTESDLYNSFYITLNSIKAKLNSKKNKNKIFESSSTGKKKWLTIMCILIFVLISIKPIAEFGEGGIAMLIPGLLFPGIGFTVLVSMVFSNKAETIYVNGVPTKSKIGTKIFGLIWGGMFGGMPWAIIVLPCLMQNINYFITYIIGIACIGAIFVFNKIIVKRTPYGIEILGKLRGFKNFLETAEKEQLEDLVMQNPEYFYNILPYTYALGVSDKWINRFETIALQAPNWYDSYHGGFSIHSFGNFMNNTMSSAATAMTSSPSSSSSGGGSSGGGSSGGGSGGGGGGSW